MGCAKSALSVNRDSLEAMWLQHAVSKSQECLSDVTERVVEVRNKTYRNTTSISTAITCKWGSRRWTCKHIWIWGTYNGCPRKMTFILLLNEFLKFLVDKDIMALGIIELAARTLWGLRGIERPELVHGGAVNVSIGCYRGEEGIANTRSEYEMWWVGRGLSSKMSSLTIVSSEGARERVSRDALVGLKSSWIPIISAQTSSHHNVLQIEQCPQHTWKVEL